MKQKNSTLQLYLVCFALAFSWSTTVLACPKISGLIDNNCDGKLKLVFIGDSIVRGRGDEVLGNKGGYPSRLRNEIKKAQIVNLGVSGSTPFKTFTLFNKELKNSRKTKIKKQLNDADYVGVGPLGTNEFYEDQDIQSISTNLKKLVAILRTYLRKQTGVSPIFSVSTLTPTKRSDQSPFIDLVNAALQELASPNALPLYVHFENLDLGYIGFDGLHPTSNGYEQMALIVEDYLRGKAQDLALVGKSDNDQDGIYDQFEKRRFKTEPKNSDTDADGLKDGEEVFEYFTDPLVIDTDGDNLSDGAEVLAGSDPLVADSETSL